MVRPPIEAHHRQSEFRGQVFDMHGPEEVFVHVPHITAAETKKRWAQSQVENRA
jgi:hypothetical protein